MDEPHSIYFPFIKPKFAGQLISPKAMLAPKKNVPKEKPSIHPRNKNRERYDFTQLIASCAELAGFVRPNLYGDESIDFADPEAVKTLNKAILKFHYGIENWDIPENYLCPPIPGRADYIHHIADLMCRNNYGKIPSGREIKCLDVGVGASCIYPIIGNREYGWSFIGADIDPISIASANKIIAENPALHGNVECKLQTNPRDYFYGIIRRDELIDFSICNPPFHSSADEARAGTIRKSSNLNLRSSEEPILNFGGQSHELWCDGGEERFIRDMIRQSRKFSNSCFLFSTLVSKESNLSSIYKVLKLAEVTEVETIAMEQGNKKSRIVAWSFLSKEEQNEWKNTRWQKRKN
jgi:23S rRNA (adenine1618-N6)-methyltransferase